MMESSRFMFWQARDRCGLEIQVRDDCSNDCSLLEIIWPLMADTQVGGDVYFANFSGVVAHLLIVSVGEPGASQRSDGKRTGKRIERQCEVVPVSQVQQAFQPIQSTTVTLTWVEPVMVNCSRCQNCTVTSVGTHGIWEVVPFNRSTACKV